MLIEARKPHAIPAATPAGVAVVMNPTATGLPMCMPHLLQVEIIEPNPPSEPRFAKPANHGINVFYCSMISFDFLSADSSILPSKLFSNVCTLSLP